MYMKCNSGFSHKKKELGLILGGTKDICGYGGWADSTGPKHVAGCQACSSTTFFSSELTNFDFRKNILTNSHVILVVALGT